MLTAHRYSPCVSQRKAAIRTSPNWLDALDLPPDPVMPRTYPAPRNAIYARRRELERRVYATAETVQVAAQPVAAVKLPPLRKRRSALSEAIRNAAILLVVGLIVGACLGWM